MTMTMTQKKRRKPKKNPPLFVELPDDLRAWFESVAERDGQSFKVKTIRIFEHYRQMEAESKPDNQP